MNALLQWFQSETGRRVVAIGLATLGEMAKGGVLPLDYAIPGLGITTGSLLNMLGISVAATSGSSSRK